VLRHAIKGFEDLDKAFGQENNLFINFVLRSDDLAWLFKLKRQSLQYLVHYLLIEAECLLALNHFVKIMVDDLPPQTW